VIRLFNVHYPVRTLILLAGEALIVCTSFLLGVALQHRNDLYVVLNYEGGYLKILAVTLLVLLFSHWFDLYNPTHFDAKGELYFRVLLVPGCLALMLALVGYAFPRLLPSDNSALAGLVILTAAMFVWRAAFGWLAQQPYLRERVYVLGTGERAQRLVNGLRARSALGVDVVGWSGNVEGAVTRDSVASHLMEQIRQQRVHRVIVAMPDRRGTLPVHELLQLRLNGIKVEEATSWLERMSGRIEVEQLYPSWLIFAEGFRFSSGLRIVRRLLSTATAALLLVLVLPVIPFVLLLIRLDSPGPVLYRQIRMG